MSGFKNVFIKRERERGRERQRETKRQRETERQRDRERKRERKIDFGNVFFERASLKQNFLREQL